MSQKDAIKLVNKYLTNLEKAGILVQKAFLYGSYARNTATENSDIDVLLISDIFENGSMEIKSLPWSLALREDFRIEPYAVGSKTFRNDDVNPLIQIVKKEGIELKLV